MVKVNIRRTCGVFIAAFWASAGHGRVFRDGRPVERANAEVR